MTQNNTTEQARNRLGTETSPYLLQHADNPVHWHPWGPEALELARSQGKPILLSVGYSACHWCHVMAHESFEDPTSAAVMNDLFINIKVDREERPDLDKIYQTAHALLTQRNGGWPLTMFLTPDDHIPFFAGTYFPKHERHGLPAFTDLLQRVAGFYQQNRSDIDRQNASLVDALESMTRTPEGETGRPDPMPLDMARQQLVQSFDDRHGGFGAAPKFPHPTSIDRLLRHWAASADSANADQQARDIALFTLRKMALGGVNDQLSGGFCRYSVDDLWMIPHFEKMLYDNGPLLALYSQAWHITKDPLFERVTRQTAAWAMHEMQSPAGGYYSSLDADSEGEEGKFYVWTPDEVREILSEEEYAIFAPRFGLDRKANFEGRWHLHIYHEYDELEQKTGVATDHARDLIDNARTKLGAVRKQRVAPGRDDKILTSWNGLMIRGMAIASRHLDEAAWEQSARRALDFIRETLWRDGRLLATCKDGHAHLNAYLDDYVYLIDGILELLQTRWRDGDLAFAIELAEVVLTHFADEKGGFFFTADDHESLIQRPKPLSDDATPSGNGVAAFVFTRLGHLLGETRYLDAAERCLQAAWHQIEQAPHAHTALLLALEEHLFPPDVVVIRGSEQETQDWLAHINRQWKPRRLAFAIPDDSATLPGILQQRHTAGGAATAWVCQGVRCLPSISSLEALEQLLDNPDQPPA